MYICLEGIDGSGKSTQITRLEEWLSDIGQKVYRVREPTGSDVGLLLRNMLESSNATEENVQRTLALLFAADRTILMKEIEKAESDGKVVISDRCFYSSMVYQNDGEWISEINKYAKRPDITILLELETETALERCDGKDHFENRDFLENVRGKYLKLAKKESFFVINANNGLNKVHDDIKRVLAPRFGVCL
jgi:dTMP kinase